MRTITTVLLFVGGEFMVVQEVAEGAPLAPPMTMRQPVPIAVLPLAISLLTLAGLIRGHFPTIVGGGIAFVVAGVMLLFSFGIWISFVGIVVSIAAAAMWRLQKITI